jgi:hypothetical protein
VAMCPKRGYGERTRVTRRVTLQIFSFRGWPYRSDTGRPAAGRHGQLGVGATGTATADSGCCDRVERPSFSYLSEKFLRPRQDSNLRHRLRRAVRVVHSVLLVRPRASELAFRSRQCVLVRSDNPI